MSRWVIVCSLSVCLAFAVSCTTHKKSDRSRGSSSAINDLGGSSVDGDGTTADGTDGTTAANTGTDASDGVNSQDAVTGDEDVNPTGADNTGADSTTDPDTVTFEDIGTEPKDVSQPPKKACESGQNSACPQDHLCIDNVCVSECSKEAAQTTGMGCEYFAVELEGAISPEANFAITVINPDGVDSVTVTVHEEVGAAPMAEKTVEIEAKGHQTIVLPPRAVNGTLKDKLSYHVKGTAPFVAIQHSHSAEANVANYSSDMTHLLPAAGFGREYFAVTGKYNGLVGIVATQDETLVSVTPTANIKAGPGIKALTAGTLYTFTLNAGEVLSLRSEGTDNDLTGTEILSTQGVAVFSGSSLTRSTDKCCADHVEQQMPPVTAWGKLVVVPRAQTRGIAKDYLRIVAGFDDTTVEFTSVGDPIPPASLNRGEWVEVSSSKSVVVNASNAVLVTRILASAHEAVSQGKYCGSDKDCPAGQGCEGASAGKSGTCRHQCKITQSNCPKAVYGCHDLFGDVKQLQQGEGMCYRNLCGSGNAPCAVGTICLAGDEASACYEPCALDQGCVDKTATGEWCGVLSGQAVCAPKSCSNDIESCPQGSFCELVPSGNHVCRFKCKPPKVCPDTGYRCLSDTFFPGDKKWFDGAICVAPNCESDKHCPSAHRCSKEGLPPYQCKPIGDPALTVEIPVEQHLKQHNIIVPTGFAYDYITIAAPATATVFVDGTAIPSGKFFPVGADYKVVTQPIADGAHRLISSEPFTVAVYGYDVETSYATHAATSLVKLQDGLLGTKPTTNPEQPGDSDAGTVEQDGPEVIAPKVTWESDIKGIIVLHCTPCHVGGGNSAGLIMDTPDFIDNKSNFCPDGALMGDSLVLKVKGDSSCSGEIMPPPSNGAPLSAEEITLIEEWKAAGFPEK